MADADLIDVGKDGVRLAVHPSCLADHRRMGWREATASDPTDDSPAKPARRRKAAGEAPDLST